VADRSTLEDARAKLAQVDWVATLRGGQTFCWQPIDRGWSGWIGGRPVSIHLDRDKDSARFQGCDLPGWLNYLHLEMDWESIHRSIREDPHVAEAVRAFPGLRLVRDPWWECLVNFLCSPLKPIPQIEILHHRLRSAYGLPTPSGRHQFPSPGVLASLQEDDLRILKLGYRAKFIHQTARCIANGTWQWEDLPKDDLEAAVTHLRKLPGVGDKIARCVLLYTGSYLGAFPIDVWTERVLTDFYWKRKRKPKLGELEAIVRHEFGPLAGIAQIYLFHWYRTTYAHSTPD
jgi:N-glycosylase/DNA lyase